ncbi:MAG: hypothetical protein ABR962_08900 [Candidatus Bathyarchaeia archaeon]
MVEAIRVVDPDRKAKLISEVKKDPSQDIKALTERIVHEPKGLKVSVYFGPEVARFVEESSDAAGVVPSVWVRNIVMEDMKAQGKRIPTAKDLVR